MLNSYNNAPIRAQGEPTVPVSFQNKFSILYWNSENSSKPGNERSRGGEFAADDCWLDGYHDDSEVRPS